MNGWWFGACFFILWLFDEIFYNILLKRSHKREARLRRNLVVTATALMAVTATLHRKNEGK